MIELNGHLVEDISVWGWPWHGAAREHFVSGLGSVPYLLRWNGEEWPLYTADPFSFHMPSEQRSLISVFKTAVSEYGGATHLVRVPGHVFPGRTSEQLLQDRARSHDWRGAAMLAGPNHALYMKALGYNGWVYSRGGQSWWMQIQVSQVPHPITAPGNTLNLTVRRRRLGVFGLEGSWLTVGTLTAPSCCTAGFSWFTPSVSLGDRPAIGLQSIRSDGGEVILELRFVPLSPVVSVDGAVGFYKLTVDNSDGWLTDLELLAMDTEVHTSELTLNNLEHDSYGVNLVVVSETETLMVQELQLDPDGITTSIVFCTGTIEQVAERICGYVYDNDDTLHEIKARYLVRHTCNVPEYEPEFSGQLVSHLDPETGEVISQDDTLKTEIHTNTSVDTLLKVSILRDGAEVSSCSAQVVTTKQIDIVDGPGETFTQHLEATSTLTLGAFEEVYSVVHEPESGSIPTGDVAHWPNAGIFDSRFFSARDGTTGLIPFPRSITPGGLWEQPLQYTQYFPSGIITTIDNHRIRLGAVRQSNNVWMPAIIAGQPGGSLNQWLQFGDGWGLDTITGIPSAVFGPRVGPDDNGPAQADYVVTGSTSATRLEGGAYDYLHQVVLPYGDIF